MSEATLEICRTHLPGAGQETDPVLRLSYEARLVRRRRFDLGDLSILVDLPNTVSLNSGDALQLENGRQIAIAAADEPLLRVSGDHLVRLAWHIGNRHTPCQIGEDHLLIQEDPVLAQMLCGLGATVEKITAPFAPEGGAYGHGRTMGHDHS